MNTTRNYVIHGLFLFLTLILTAVFIYDKLRIKTIEVNIYAGFIPEEAADSSEGNFDFFWLQLWTIDGENRDISLSSCIATSPTGEVFVLAPKTNTSFRISYDPDDEMELEKGDCCVVIKDLQEEDTGRWILKAVDNRTGNTYIGYNFYKVRKATKEVPANGQTIPEIVKAQLHQEVTIRLVSNSTRALNMCLAVSPNGTKYHLAGVLPESYKKSNSVVYAGQSLDQGDCGAKIGPMERDFHGRWRFKSREVYTSNYTTAYTNIALTSTDV